MTAALKHIGFTGSQYGGSKGAQLNSLRRMFLYLQEHGAEWQHNGDCIGWDKWAGLLWRTQLGGNLWCHPPTNSSKRAYLFCDKCDEPLPYLERNRVIVARSAILVAAPDTMFEKGRSGTWATVRYMRKQSKPVAIIWPDGTETLERWQEWDS